LYWSQFSVLLFDEEEWSHIWAFRGANIAFCHVFFYELEEFFLFSNGESVYFPWNGGWSVGFQFYSVVLDARTWKSLSC